MTFSYSAEFVLDKAHFQECYQQTAVIKSGLKAYQKSLFLFVLGMLSASIAQQYQALALFIIVLSVVDALSVKFAQTWWVWRQLLSKAANTKVQLVIDDKGIATSSLYQKLELSWQAIFKIEKTEKGIVIHHQDGRSYLSNTSLSQEVIAYLTNKTSFV